MTDGSAPASTVDVPLMRGLIDVHLHFVPDVYRRSAVAAGWGTPDGMPGIPAWSEAGMLEMMDRVGIARGMLSISSPGVYFGDLAAARDLSRAVNLEGARIVGDRPGRFGLFASLPLPDVDGALREIAFAFDELGADGVYLQTNAGGIYPGDTAFDPVFAELDRRCAVVFMHPTSPNCPCCGSKERPLPRPMLEFMFETTRAVANLILSGTLDRYRNLKLIVPHAGAALPVLADRIALIAEMLPSVGVVPFSEIVPTLSRLYYDLAGVPVPRLFPALRSFADPQHLLYGSDWPHTPTAVVERNRQQVECFLALEPALLADVSHGNARRLLRNGELR